MGLDELLGEPEIAPRRSARNIKDYAKLDEVVMPTVEVEIVHEDECERPEEDENQ
jgi:hypothetical protein